MVAVALMHVYPVLAITAAVGVIVLELRWFRSGIFASRAFCISMVIVFGFMVVVDGWLTKLSAPIVIYDDRRTTGIRPVWDILVEEYAYAFALLTMVVLLWDRQGTTPERHAGGDVEQPDDVGALP
ncbi:MAG: lycopene cyclase domain protein [Ilumatobacteraceae bacterium]|nr:lycopene cyclase domain protein [Ilumatobacteraceae bacterium]